MVHGLSKVTGSTAVFRNNYILKSSVHFHLCFLFGAKTPPSCDTSYCSIRANCRSSVKAFWTSYSYLPTRAWYLISASVHRHFQKVFDLRWTSDLRGWGSQQSSWNAHQHQSQNILFSPPVLCFCFPPARLCKFGNWRPLWSNDGIVDGVRKNIKSLELLRDSKFGKGVIVC